MSSLIFYMEVFMKDKTGCLQTKNYGNYPIVFNLNVLEEIQENYGSISEWGKVVETTDSDGVPKISDLKVGLLSMINEGIDIKNETSDTKQEFVNLKQVGRIITDAGLENVLKAVKDVSLSSTQDEE